MSPAMTSRALNNTASRNASMLANSLPSGSSSSSMLSRKCMKYRAMRCLLALGGSAGGLSAAGGQSCFPAIINSYQDNVSKSMFVFDFTSILGTRSLKHVKVAASLDGYSGLRRLRDPMCSRPVQPRETCLVEQSVSATGSLDPGTHAAQAGILAQARRRRPGGGPGSSFLGADARGEPLYRPRVRPRRFFMRAALRVRRPAQDRRRRAPPDPRHSHEGRHRRSSELAARHRRSQRANADL